MVAGRSGDDSAVRIVQAHLSPRYHSPRAASRALGCVVGSPLPRQQRADCRLSWRDAAQPDNPHTYPVLGEESSPLAEAASRAQLLGWATGLARDLANTPSGHKDRAWLPGRARFGGVLAVGGGSGRLPRLVELAWQPAKVSAEEHLIFLVSHALQCVAE